MAVIGLDVGTSGTKCIIADEFGKVMSQAYKDYPTEIFENGYFELNPEVVWEAVVEVIRSSVDKFEGDVEEIKGISVSSLGEAAVLLDKNGDNLGNSILYIDSRGNEELKCLINDLGEESITKRTGLRPHTMYTLPKLMWYKEHQPELYEKTEVFLPFGSFILYKLGCTPVMDYSLASRTMAFNVTELRWDDEIIEASKINKVIFPPVKETGSIVGSINPKIANELGLPQELQLVLGAHDQVCAAIGSGISKVNTAVYGMGTVGCICPVFNNEVNLDEISSSNFPLVPYINDKYTTYAFNFTGGSLLKWFRDEFAFEEKLEADTSNRSVYEILNEKASSKPTDIIVIPHFAGSGTPNMNPLSKGVFLGISFETKKEDIYRALMEGITYEMKYNIDCLNDVGISVDELSVCGGGSQSDLWLQITADIMNKKITALDINEAGILGTIILTGVALGTYASYEEAAKQLIKVNKVFYPKEENLRKYEKNYIKYKKLLEATQEFMTLAE